MHSLIQLHDSKAEYKITNTYKIASAVSILSSSDCGDSVPSFFVCLSFNLFGNFSSFLKNHVIARRNRGGKRLLAHSIKEPVASVLSPPILIRNMKEM